MRELFNIDMKDYKETDKHFFRPSARGIILMGDKIALVYSTVGKYYKFPGGGIHEDEDKVTALIREVEEEVGMEVIPSSVREYGVVHRLQKSKTVSDTVFDQYNYYYFCNVTENVGAQHLDDYEAEAGFELRIVSFDEAIQANEACPTEDAFNKVMAAREARVLKMLKDELG